MKRSLVALILGSSMVAVPVWAERNDVVIMKNGDRLTCSVKQLDRGRLRVTTDHMGTVFIDWTHVSSIQAAKTYEVELGSGEALYGSLEAGRADGSLALRTERGVEELPIDRIVYVTEIKRGFFKRLDGSIDFGFNYQKANNDVNYSIGANAMYRTRKNETDLQFNSILSNRNDSPRAFRNVLHGTYTHFLNNRWYAMGLAGAEQNDELGLDLRTSLGGGAGRYIFQTNRSRMSLAGGLTTNREKYITDTSPQTSLEALASVSYDFFIHGDHGTDISSSLTLFPSLTESGRYRAEFNAKYRQEIVTDLFVSLSGWYSFDNKAPIGDDATVKQDDYGLVTSLGWKF